MEEKTCAGCKQVKILSEFPKDKYTKSGYGGYCKVCKREKSKSTYLKNPDKHKNRVKDWNQNNPDKVKQHVLNSSEYKKQWYLDNKTRLNQLSKEYNQNKRNSEGVYYNNGEWIKVKPKMTLEERKLVNTFRDKIRRATKLNRKSSLDILGCSISEFKAHIESQFLPEMNWDNWGVVWELDHIIGCAKFDMGDEQQIKSCFNFTNYQPLFKTTKIALSFGYDIIGNRNKPKY